MKCIVVYFSQTGNTEKIARSIQKGVQQIGAKHLADTEARGRFRRLISLDKLNWETPIFQVYNTHPRFIIGKGRP